MTVVNLRPAPPAPLRCPGVGRDAENAKALVFSFSRPVTDHEMRFLHEVLQRAAYMVPDDEGGGGDG